MKFTASNACTEMSSIVGKIVTRSQQGCRAQGANKTNYPMYERAISTTTTHRYT